MKYCRYCGKELLEAAVICPACGCATGHPAPTPTEAVPAEDDTVHVGLCALSVFVPLFGVIYWPLKYRETPKRATACGIAGIVAWVMWAVFYMILWEIM